MFLKLIDNRWTFLIALTWLAVWIGHQVESDERHVEVCPTPSGYSHASGTFEYQRLPLYGILSTMN